MLKKVATAEMRLGMYLHGLEGSWLEHPFWRRKFVLDDAAELASLRASGVTHGWIDVAKGLDVEVAADAREPSASPVSPPPVARPTDPPPAVPSDPDAVPVPSARFEDEIERAARLCIASRRQVQAMLGEVRLGRAICVDSVQPLVEDLVQSVFRHPGALVSLARLKSKDDYTYMHSVAVSALMVALARQLGFGAAACREAGLAGLLHDVGKALLPGDVLNKPGALNDAEFALVRRHPSEGHAFLERVGGFPPVALDVCLHHHEKFDGTGYPGRLQGEAISRLARMGAICDVYDAITSNRSYRAAWDPSDAIARMASWKGHFDPTIFAAFVQSLGIYPTGSLVRLRSQRLAVVCQQHPTELTQPTVKVFFSLKSKLPIPVHEIDLARADANDAIVGREPRTTWNFPQLDVLWAGEAANRH